MTNTIKTSIFISFLVLPTPGFPASGLDAETNTVWTSFKTAVLENRQDSVISLSAFPIPANDLGGPIKSENQLRNRFNKIFELWVKECFKSAKPEPSNNSSEFVINCNGYFFGFRNINGSYKFAYIDNVNE